MDDAWMPNMAAHHLDGIALHGGRCRVCGSHGCVRMPFGFAEKLFDKTRDGMRGDHLAEGRRGGQVLPSGNVRAEREPSRPRRRRQALAPRGGEGCQDGRRGEKAARDTARETASLTSSLRELQGLKAPPTPRFAYADKAAPPPQRRTKPRRGPRTSSKGSRQGSGPEDPVRHRQGGREVEARRSRRRKRSGQGGPDKEGDAANAASEAKLAIEPVSVTSAARRRSFTCGATHIGRRRTAAARYSMRPSRFRSQSAIPTSRSARMCSRRWRATDAGLRWSVVTVDNGDDAKDALDRITIPQDVLGRIAPTALPRSSIIISDEAAERRDQLSTEFIAWC